MTDDRRETGGYSFSDAVRGRQRESTTDHTGNGQTRTTGPGSGGGTDATRDTGTGGSAPETGGSDDDAGTDAGGGGGGLPDRRKFTQRMPEDLVEQIDDFAESHGMSRNAAINMLAKTGLDEFP